MSLYVQTRFGMLGKVYSEFLFVVNQNYCCIPFPGFLSHSDRILARFQLGNVFIIRNMFIMKNLTDFCKMMETGVEPCLVCLF